MEEEGAEEEECGAEESLEGEECLDRDTGSEEVGSISRRKVASVIFSDILLARGVVEVVVFLQSGYSWREVGSCGKDLRVDPGSAAPGSGVERGRCRV